MVGWNSVLPLLEHTLRSMDFRLRYRPIFANPAVPTVVFSLSVVLYK